MRLCLCHCLCYPILVAWPAVLMSKPEAPPAVPTDGSSQTQAHITSHPAALPDTQIRTQTHTHINTHALTHTHTDTHAHVQYVHRHTAHTHTCMLSKPHRCTYRHTHTCAYMFTLILHMHDTCVITHTSARMQTTGPRPVLCSCYIV